jgi:hypothetical protein
MNTFVKQYPDARRAAAAVAHLGWLSALHSGVRLPALRYHRGTQVGLEHLDGRTPGPNDLPVLARALGQLHATAHGRDLHRARLDEPYRSRGLPIADFITPRRDALHRQPVPHHGLPAALYKDANIRNFLITSDGVAIVDFDDLTLAPFGYDLAKLIVTTAMTHGEPGPVDAALTAYNARVGPNACPPHRLHIYAELHHVLTAGYLGRNGYRHPWPQARPRPEPNHHRPPSA